MRWKMLEAEIEEIRVKNLGSRHFLIPSYQRGYRWSPQNVKELLDDLKSFCKERKSDLRLKYCLQPIVLQKTDRGERIVDGQQRITTISLILYALSERKTDFPWDLEYEELDVSLKKILSDGLGKNGRKISINEYFMLGVIRATERWRNDNKDFVGDVYDALCPTEGVVGIGGVFFIQYYIPELGLEGSDKKAHETFDELNDGKIPLTSSELIKACFLVYDSGLPIEEQLSIAKEWEVLEKALQDQELWAIWNTREYDDCPTRIDLLFGVIVGSKMDLRLYDKLIIYHDVEKWIDQTIKASHCERKDALSELWEKVLRCYWWMAWCVKDVRVHNLLGWLAWHTEDSVAILYKEIWLKQSKSCSSRFYLSLQKRIIEEKFKNRSHDLSQYSYDTNKEDIPYILGLVNVLRANDQNERLPFDLIRNRNGGGWSWQIEHINSQTENSLEDENVRRNWIEMASEELSPDERKELSGKSTITEKWRYVVNKFAPRDEILKLQNEHCVGNLALLDSVTNEGYKNAIFPRKRKIIFSVAKNVSTLGRPILPCTMMAFSKMESSNAAQMRFWSQTDAERFQEDQQKLLDAFFCKGTTK